MILINNISKVLFITILILATQLNVYSAPLKVYIKKASWCGPCKNLEQQIRNGALDGLNVNVEFLNESHLKSVKVKNLNCSVTSKTQSSIEKKANIYSCMNHKSFLFPAVMIIDPLNDTALALPRWKSPVKDGGTYVNLLYDIMEIAELREEKRYNDLTQFDLKKYTQDVLGKGKRPSEVSIPLVPILKIKIF